MIDRTERPERVRFRLDAEYDLSIACVLPDDEDERAEIVAEYEAEYVRQAAEVSSLTGITIEVSFNPAYGDTATPLHDSEDWPTWEHMLWQECHDRISVARDGRICGLTPTSLVWAM